MKAFKVMVFKGELDCGFPDKVILETCLILVNLNGKKYFLLENAILVKSNFGKS